MAKTQNVSFLSPDGFATGADVIEEDAQSVAEMLNWTAGNRPVVYVNATVGEDGWATNAIGILALRFRASGGFTTVLRGRIRINPDVQGIVVGARCIFASTEGGDVKFTVGSGTATLSFTDSDNGSEKTSTIATSSTGTGLQTWQVEIDQTSGASSTNQLRNVRIEAAPITTATDLPSPANE